MSKADLNSILGSNAYWQVNKKLAKHFKCNNTALLISDFLSKENYFSENTKNFDGWFYNTQEMIEEDTNISPYQQRKCIKNLQEAGFIETDLRGLPAKLHFKILHNKLLSFFTTSPEVSLEQDAKFLYTNKNKVNKNKRNKNKGIKMDENKFSPNEPGIQNVSVSQEAEKKAPPISGGTPPKSTYQMLIDIYWDWFKERNDGVPPKIDGIEGKATKQLVKYFESVSKSKAGDTVLLPQEVQKQVCEMFMYILNRWSSLEPFLQKQTKLAQINSNITNIINFLKNGHKTQSAHQRKQDRESVYREGRAIIRDYYNQKESD